MLTKLGNFLYLSFAAWMNQEVDKAMVAPSDLSRAAPALVAGDVILVEGRTRIGRLIKNVSQSPWTHCAVFVGRISDHKETDIYPVLKNAWQGSDNEYLLLEAEIGTGSLLTSIEKYDDYNVRICRPQSLTQKDADNVITNALSRLDHDYDVRQLFDLARLMYPYRLVPRRWRSSLFETRNNNKEKRTICSTLIADAFYSVDFPIRPIINKDKQGNLVMNNLNARLCTPRDFDASPYFDILKFPWVPISKPGVYRQLPWEDSGASTPSPKPTGSVAKTNDKSDQNKEFWARIQNRSLMFFKSLRSWVKPSVAK